MLFSLVRFMGSFESVLKLMDALLKRNENSLMFDRFLLFGNALSVRTPGS